MHDLRAQALASGFVRLTIKMWWLIALGIHTPFFLEHNERRTCVLQIQSVTCVLLDLGEFIEPVSCNGGQFNMQSPSGNVREIALQC